MLGTKPFLTLTAAKQIAAAASKEAQENQWNMVIAIVDDGGHPLYLERMDGVQVGSVQVAIEKARSAALFKRATKVFEDAVQGGRQVLMTLPGAVPVEGGIPLAVRGQVIGAVGVSGGTSTEDGAVAQAGAAALSAL